MYLIWKVKLDSITCLHVFYCIIYSNIIYLGGSTWDISESPTSPNLNPFVIFGQTEAVPNCPPCHQTSLVRASHVVPHKSFPSQGPERTCDAYAVSGKLNLSILVISNLSKITLGLKSQKNTNTLDLYIDTHMLTLKRTVLDGQFPWTINNSWARMTHR